MSQAIAPATQAPATVSASTAAPSVIEDDDVILIPENIPFINLCDSPFSQPLQAFNDNSQMNQSGILECLVLQGPNENRPLIPVSRQERRARQSRLTFRPVPDIIM